MILQLINLAGSVGILFFLLLSYRRLKIFFKLLDHVTERLNRLERKNFIRERKEGVI